MIELWQMSGKCDRRETVILAGMSLVYVIGQWTTGGVRALARI